MPSKTKEKNREYQRKWWKANKVTQMAKVKANQRRIAKWATTLKDNKPCTDCKVGYPHYVMDWDHLYDKKFAVSEMSRMGSKRKILEEVAKCELVCSNCHRVRTYLRRTAPP